MLESSTYALMPPPSGLPLRSKPILLTATPAPIATPTPVEPTPTAAEKAPTTAAIDDELDASMSIASPTLLMLMYALVPEPMMLIATAPAPLIEAAVLPAATASEAAALRARIVASAISQNFV